jgi:hypothetical protein
MRNSWMVAAVVLVGCSAADGTKPWDQNHDGLVSACEGLNHDACAANPGCELQPTYCTMDCRDDGHGGCVPCTGGEICRPVAPPPVPDCSNLPVALCQLLPACEVVTQTMCTGVREPEPTDPSVPPQHGCIGPPDQCQTIQTCVNRPMPSCESLPVDACLAHAGCALAQQAIACPAVCQDDGNGGCVPTPCQETQERCVSIAPSCETRSPDTCLSTPGCALQQSDYACPAVCEDDGHGGCLPCPQPEPRCVPTGPVTGTGGTSGSGSGETPPAPPQP